MTTLEDHRIYEVVCEKCGYKTGDSTTDVTAKIVVGRCCKDLPAPYAYDGRAGTYTNPDGEADPEDRNEDDYEEEAAPDEGRVRELFAIARRGRERAYGLEWSPHRNQYEIYDVASDDTFGWLTAEYLQIADSRAIVTEIERFLDDHEARNQLD